MDDVWAIPLGLAYVIILVLSLGLNGSLLCLFACRRSLRSQSQSTKLLISLITADFIVALCGLERLFGSIWDQAEQLNWVLISITLVSMLASLLNLFAVSIDRFLAIVRPLRYHEYITERTTRKALGFIWIVTLTVSLLTIVVSSTFKKKSIIRILAAIVFILAVFGGIGLTVINAIIYSRVKKQIRLIQSLQVVTTSSCLRSDVKHISSSRKKELKSAYLCLSFVLTFLIFWTPNTILVFGYFIQEMALSTELLMELASLSMLCNTLIDPVLYIALNRNLRDQIKMVCRSRKRTRKISVSGSCNNSLKISSCHRSPFIVNSSTNVQNTESIHPSNTQIGYYSQTLHVENS